MAAGLRRAGPPGSFGVRLTVANTGGGSCGVCLSSCGRFPRETVNLLFNPKIGMLTL